MGKIGHPLLLCVFWYTSSNINKKNFSDSSSLWKISKFCFFYFCSFLYIRETMSLPFFGKFQLFIGKKKVVNWENVKLFVAGFQIILCLKKFNGDLLSNRRTFRKGLKVRIICSVAWKLLNCICLSPCRLSAFSVIGRT